MNDKELIEAVKAGNYASVKELSESGADVNQQDSQGWTPLNWAAARGDLKAVELLIQLNADVSKVGRDQRTPEMIALAAGHAEVVKILREAEARVSGKPMSRPAQKYCMAYHLSEFRQFPEWTETISNARSSSGSDGDGQPDQALSDDDIVFLHQNYTVTKSIWADENVIFNQVTDHWKDFCANVLKFKVPDSLDLIVTAGSARG